MARHTTPHFFSELGEGTNGGERSRSAWVLLFAAALMLGVTAMFWLLHGRLFSTSVLAKVTGSSSGAVLTLFPGSARITEMMARLAGTAGVTASVLAMWIAATSYRRGERWSWYAMWALPLYAAFELAVLLAYGGLTLSSGAWNLAFIGLSLLGLALPYRSFFEERPAAA